MVFTILEIYEPIIIILKIKNDPLKQYLNIGEHAQQNGSKND